MSDLTRCLERIEGKLDEMLARMDEADLRAIQQRQMDQLGHQLVYDRLTGTCLNIPGAPPIDPALLDEYGFQCRLAARRRV